MAPPPGSKRSVRSVEREPDEWADLLRQGREMVRAYLARDDSRVWPQPRLGDVPEGRALLDAPPPLQIAAIYAALDEVVERHPRSGRTWDATAQAAARRRYRSRDILVALLRRKQPFSAADIDVLVTAFAPPEENRVEAALTSLLEILPNRSLGAIVADVAALIQRLPDMPGLWDHFWYARSPIDRLLQRIEQDGLVQSVRPQLLRLRDGVAPHAGVYAGSITRSCPSSRGD